MFVEFPRFVFNGNYRDAPATKEQILILSMLRGMLRGGKMNPNRKTKLAVLFGRLIGLVSQYLKRSRLARREM